VLEVGSDNLRDRVATVNEPEVDEHAFDSSLEMVERFLAVDRSPVQRFLRRLTVFEFSPYLQAFGPLPDEGPVAAPTPPFGGPFTGRARLRGAEQVSVPAGSFDAVRMDYEVSRPTTVTMRPEFDPAFILATVWYVASVKRPVRWTVVARASDRNILVDDTYELTSYRPA